jgi:hypothetical protein
MIQPIAMNALSVVAGNEATVRLAYDSGPLAHMHKWRALVLLMLGDKRLE